MGYTTLRGTTQCHSLRATVPFPIRTSFDHAPALQPTELMGEATGFPSDRSRTLGRPRRTAGFGEVGKHSELRLGQVGIGSQTSTDFPSEQFRDGLQALPHESF